MKYYACTNRNYTCTFTLEEFECGETLLDLELAISYWPVPYTPAVMYHADGSGSPAEGGGCEDLSMKVTLATHDGRILSAAELVDVQAAFERQHKTDPKLRNQIEKHCGEDYADRQDSRDE